MTLDEIDALIADGHKRLAPLEVHPDVRQEAIAAGEVGMYPGDEAVLPKFQQAGKKEFEALRTDRLALTDQVKKARIQEKQFRDQDSFLNRAKETVSNLFTPDEVVQPNPTPIPPARSTHTTPASPQPFSMPSVPQVAPQVAPGKAGKLSPFSNPSEEEAFMTWYGNKAVSENLPRHPNHNPAIDYRQEFLKEQDGAVGDAPYGMREDGTPKGLGYFGELPSRDAKFNQGSVSTELSATAEVDGKELFFPLLVPTLTRQEIDTLLSGQKPTDAIYDKAIAHAQQRIAQGKDPFAGEGEQVPLPTDAPEQPLDTPEVHVVGDPITHIPQVRQAMVGASQLGLQMPPIQTPPNKQLPPKPLVFTDKAGNVTRTVPTPEMLMNLPRMRPLDQDARDVGRQAVAGAVVDLPKMTGQAMQALSAEGTVAQRWGKEMAAAATLREAGWKPDLQGRGSIAQAFLNGGRSIAPSLATIAAYMNPYGAVAGPLATVALFGGSQFQEEYDKVKKAGGTDEDARNAGIITGALQGGGEVLANTLTLGMFGLGKTVAKDQLARLLSKESDSSMYKPWAKATGTALVGEPATEIGQDVGTALTERAYGLPTNSLSSIAKESGGAAIAMTAILSPFGLFGHYRNAERANAIDKVLTDPAAASPQERTMIVRMLHEEAKGLHVADADTWMQQALQDVQARKPIRRNVMPQDAQPGMTPDQVITKPSKASPSAAEAPFAGEPTPKPARQTPPVMPGATQQPITGMIPDQLHLAQRPPFLIKQQPAPAAPELPPAMVPTSPEQAPVLSEDGGRPVEPMAQEVAEQPPLPPASAPVLESPSQAPAAPAMTPEEIVPGADPSDIAQPAMSNTQAPVDTPAELTDGERPIESDAEFDAKLKRVTDFARNSALPDHAKQAIISQERMLDTNKGIDAHLTDADWETVTVPIDELREKNAALWSGKFTHRGSMSKGPIVLDRDGEIIDGNNRTFEAIQRGDKTIEAYRPFDASTAVSGQTPDEIIKQRGYDLAGKPLTPENIVDHAAHEAATQNSSPFAGEPKPQPTVDQPVQEPASQPVEKQEVTTPETAIEAPPPTFYDSSKAQTPRVREPNEGSYYASVEGHAAMEAAEEAQWQRAPDRAKASLKEWIENEGQKGLTRLRDAALRLWSGRSDVSTDEDAETLQELYDSGEPIRDLLKTRAKNGKVTLYRGLRNATRKEESPSVQSYALDRGIAGYFAGENGTVETVQVNVDDVIAMASTAEMEVLVRGKAKQPVAQPVTPENVVDQAAHEAATSPKNDVPTPTEAMQQAGNYRKGHVSIAGLDISIENPQGSTRSGKDASGKPWSVQMKSHYGYFKGTVGKDKDHVDVFIKPGTTEDYSGTVYVVDQNDPKTGRFDEHKVILGAASMEEAKQLYRENYKKDWKGLGGIRSFPMQGFKDWIKNPNATKQPASAYNAPKKLPSDAFMEAIAEIDAKTFDYTVKGKRPTTRQIIADWKKAGQPKDFNVIFGETEARFYRGKMGNGPERWQDEGNGALGVNRTEVVKALQAEQQSAATPDEVVEPKKPSPAVSVANLLGELSGLVNAKTLTEEQRQRGEALADRAFELAETSPGLTQQQRANIRNNVRNLRERLKVSEQPATPGNIEYTVQSLRPGSTPETLSVPATPQTEAQKEIERIGGPGITRAQDLIGLPVIPTRASGINQEKNKGDITWASVVDGKLTFRNGTGPTFDSKDFYRAGAPKAEASTPDTVATKPTKGAIIDQAPTPEEATNAQPQQPRVEDTRPPEGISPEDVSAVEGSGKPESARPRPAKPSRRPTDNAGASGVSTARSDGDAEGSDIPPDRGGRAESGGDAATVPGQPGSDFILTDTYELPTGQKGKYKANIDAIKLLKRIEVEGRLASPDEQATLAQYTGWGGLPQAFQWSQAWQKEFSELRELLTEEEYAAARASTPNAHYTDPATIRAIYRGLEHLGFKGGRVLEPGAGVGHFFGAMPAKLVARSQRTAIERDSLSARLAKQLYQRANVIHGEYQSSVLPDNFFDVAVGNVPFADVNIFDQHNKELSKLHLSLHDYYFAKALSQVRPGGIVAFITSRYTMDKVNGKMRDYIATKADLLGAIRLPNTQFKAIANTDVTTDIIVLQRREDGTPAAGQPWAVVDKVQAGNEEVVVNQYFKAHPEQIMGKLSTQGSMYRDNEITVENDGRNMDQALDEAFKRLPEKVLRPRQQPKSTTARGLLEALEANDDVKDGAYTIQNNALYVRRGNQFVPMEGTTPTDLERAKGLIGIRDQVREVFKTQLGDVGEAAMKGARDTLNKQYDRFVKKFGPINGRANKSLFREDPDYGTLQALEKKYDPKTNTAKKADIFSKRVIEYRPKALKAESPKEAMLVSMNDTGRIDWDRMQELTGQTPEAMQQELKGIIYKNPSGEWESADSYLSGNIRAKLKAAEAATKIDKQYQENVDALKAVIPEDLKPAQIDVKLGHGWIPTRHYRDFIAHLFDVPASRVKVNYNAHVGAFAVQSPVGRGNAKNDATYGTGRYGGIDLIVDALGSKLPTVYDLIEDDKRVVNEKETLAAREKLQKIQDEFKKWIWADDARAQELGRLYNDEFNNVRQRTYDGSHLTLPGANPLITLYPHQKNSIWRALQSGNTLLAHVVGAGKTYTMIGIAMESRRLRLANKPMIVVPNHLVEQWRDAFLQLYPAAKVLMPAKEDFQAANRKKLVGRIATGDWDAVVVAHSQLAKVPVSVETFEKFVTEQVKILDEYLHELKEDKGGNRNVIKEIEKSKERLLAKLKARKAAIAERSDTGVNFEETGVDMLMVDEADLFKNLWFPTRMTRVAGLPNTESARAYDLFLKTQYLNKITNQRGIVFATGTPTSNSMAEAFTMQRYLQPTVLDHAGLEHFDAWARQFGNTVTSMELAPDGSGYRPRTRFAEFVNVPELTQMFRQVMDVKDQGDLKLPVPKLRTGKPINVVAKPSPELIAYTKTLIERAAALKSGRVDPRVDNMLKITGDGRNAALDVRLRVPGAPEDRNGKVAMAINHVYEEYTKSNAVKGTQLVFLDLSTPKGSDGKDVEIREGMKQEAANARDRLKQDKPTFDKHTKKLEEAAAAGNVAAAEALERHKKSVQEIDNADAAFVGEVDAIENAMIGSVYNDIKRKLVKKGIPEKEIAFIHDADTDAKKSKLFADVNAGTIRVLIGSTEKMGAGTNVQERLVALHNIDAPWRPRDLEQRNGRGIRQGNKLYEADPSFELAIFNYATEAPSFDVYMWQTLEVKAKTITQIMKGDPNIRTIQDVDSAVLSYAEMKAIASGNPLILERVKLDTERRKLSLLRSAHQDGLRELRWKLTQIPKDITNEQAHLEKWEGLAKIVEDHPAEPFSLRWDKTEFDSREEAGKELLKMANEAITDTPATKRSGALRYPAVGTYRGFPVNLFVQLDDSIYMSLGNDLGITTSAFMPADVKPANVILRLDNAVQHVDDVVAATKKKIADKNKELTNIADEVNKPFEHIARIDELEAKLADIDKKLDLTNKDENVMGGEGSTDTKKPEKPDDGPLGILKSERGSIPVSLFSKGPKYAKDAKAYREQRLKEERGFASSDESIEARVRAAKQGVQPGALWPRLKEHLNHVWHLVSREYEHLPDTAEFSPLRTDLLRLQKYKGIAADQTQRELAAIVKPLDKKQYDQFEWKALLSDLKREAEEERALPFGYTPEKVQEDLDRLDEIIERDPKVRDAWAKRQALWSRLKNEYQKSMDAIGFDTSKKLTKTDYFRHQVLEYARERHLKGTGARVRTPTGRGFLKVRQGSSMDINANYVQAEFEVMAQMVYDTQLAKVIRNVDRHYNIRKALEQEAKAQNNESLQRIIDGNDERAVLVEAAMKDFRKRIGMHMGMLRKALELDKHDPLSMEDIAEMAADPDSPGNLSSRGILKAISERKAFVKETLGREFMTWEMLIPETHELWQPREGNVFYMADSIPAQLAKALQEGMLAESGITPEKLRKVLAMGNPREQYVIPKEAATTLNDLSHKEHSWFVDMNRQLLGHWKQLMLIAPRKVLRYNIRNLTGDADALFVGNPSAFKMLPAASKDLVPVIFDDKPLTGEAKEWAQRGGYGTTLQMQELGELNDLEAFKATLERESKGGWLKAPAAVWNKYWKAARLGTDYREALMRYAAYLDYLEQMREGNGRPKNFGASIKETVMALPDVRDRAFKLSNELLGAYDRVSVAGQTIRSFWIPFWSWQEVNASRYYRMMRNAFDAGDTGSKLRGATVTTKQAAAFLVKASLMWATLQAWNYLMYGDDEDELKDANPTVANRPHILFGRSDDGKIRYLAGIGALGDLLAWFGLDEFPGLVGDLMHDRMTIGEALKRSAKAPLLKIVGGLTPLVKMPAELLTRQSFYPDPLNPRPIQDRGDYLADQTTFGPEIKAARGKPGKPLYGGDDLTGLLVQRTDPKAAAYSTWQGIEKKYLERMGKESSSVFWRSPRGQALANWSRAIADHDEKAEAHYKAEYEQMEREKYGYKFSQTKMWKDIEQSLRAKAPLAGVTIAERNAIVKELDEQEKRTLHKAETYYRDTLLSVLPEVRRRSFAHKLERKGWLTKEPMGMTPETVMP